MTFAAFGALLGLDEPQVLDALEEALRSAGPGIGGRFVAPLHPIGEDPTSIAAVDAIRARASTDGAHA